MMRWDIQEAEGRGVERKVRARRWSRRGEEMRGEVKGRQAKSNVRRGQWRRERQSVEEQEVHQLADEKAYTRASA